MIRTLLFLCLVFPGISIAQTTITGRTVDDQKRNISDVTISYYKPGSSVISGFTRSKSDGTFTLSVNAESIDSIRLELRHLAYKNEKKVVANKNAFYTFTLEPDVQEIEEIWVTPKPIYSQQDTLNYRVEAFRSKEDRSIADVIKKLPGIEVQNGEILYQGKPIQKYMVNNLDLMEGRYSLINNNLPADEVQSIQIIEDDQPIKILDSLVFSDRATLNLKLKRYTSTGSGEIGLGASPTLWELNLTPMTFNKSFQMLNTLHTNNVGKDASDDLRIFYSGGMSSSGDRNTVGPSFLSLSNISSPGINTTKWLNNKLFMASSNLLKKLKNGFELKGNISYLNDFRKRSGYLLTETFAPNQYIVLNEAINNGLRLNDLNAGVLIEKNERKLYFRNSFRYHRQWNAGKGTVTQNKTNEVIQYSNYSDQSLLNSFSMAKFIGKQLVNVESQIEWLNTPQNLTILPGQFFDILNEGNPYEQLNQTVNFNQFKINNKLSFTIRASDVSITPSAKINYKTTKLSSDIHIKDYDNEKKLGRTYINDSDSRIFQTTLALTLNYEKGHWRYRVNLPYSFITYNLTEFGKKSLYNEVRPAYSPHALVIFTADGKSELSAETSYQKNYRDLASMYTSFLVTDYQNIRRNEARILGSKEFSTGFNYRYKDILGMNFVNASYRFLKVTQNYIYSTIVDGEGRSITRISDRTGRRFNHVLRAGISRFLSLTETTVKLNSHLMYGQSDYSLNEVIGTLETFSYGGNLELINDVLGFLNLNYKTTFNVSNTLYENYSKKNMLISNNHFLNLIISPLRQHSISINNSYYHNNISSETNQYFLDLNYQYRIKKWNVDLTFSAQNLLNNHEYIQQLSSSYQVVINRFEMRPRQFFISTSFKF